MNNLTSQRKLLHNVHDTYIELNRQKQLQLDMGKKIDRRAEIERLKKSHGQW